MSPGDRENVDKGGKSVERTIQNIYN
jgi:hypothetical protein